MWEIGAGLLRRYLIVWLLTVNSDDGNNTNSSNKDNQQDYNNYRAMAEGFVL